MPNSEAPTLTPILGNLPYHLCGIMKVAKTIDNYTDTGLLVIKCERSSGTEGDEVRKENPASVRSS